MSRSALDEVFSQYHWRRLADDPYQVLIESDLTFEELVAELRVFPFELTVIELGRVESFRGLGLGPIA